MSITENLLVSLADFALACYVNELNVTGTEVLFLTCSVNLVETELSSLFSRLDNTVGLVTVE